MKPATVNIDFKRQEKDLTFPCERLRLDNPVKSYKVCNILGRERSYIYGYNFAVDLVRKSAHMHGKVRVIDCVLAHTLHF